MAKKKTVKKDTAKKPEALKPKVREDVLKWALTLAVDDTVREKTRPLRIMVPDFLEGSWDTENAKEVLDTVKMGDQTLYDVLCEMYDSLSKLGLK